jgi:hypothetical protein
MSRKPDRNQDLEYLRRDFWLGVVVVLLAVIGVVAIALLLFAEPARAQSSDRIFTDGFEEFEAGAELCDSPLVMPAAWAFESKTWVDAFSRPGGTPAATYPNSVGNPVPVPGYRWFRRLQVGQFEFYKRGQFVAIGFVAQASTTVDITWDTAQSGPNYTTPRPADMMHVGLSPCPWDARPHALCSVTAGQASLFGSTRTDQPGSFCPMVAGATYYLNVLMANPNDGLTFGENVCSETAANSAEGCDVQMRHTGTFGVLRHQRLGGWED